MAILQNKIETYYYIKSNKGEFSTTLHLPDDDKGNPQTLTFTWNKENDFTVKVPDVVIVKQLRKELVVSENYAKHLLDSYKNILELVKSEDVPKYEAPKLKVPEKVVPDVSKLSDDDLMKELEKRSATLKAKEDAKSTKKSETKQ